jgi:hypothetical protein
MIAETSFPTYLSALPDNGLIRMCRVTLEFIGGFWDGANLCAYSPDTVQSQLAMQTYTHTGDGAMGQEVVMPCRYGLGQGAKGNRYIVTNHTEMEGEILVRLQCYSHQDVEHCAFPDHPASLVRRILLRFQGGCLDGVTLDSHSADYQESFACLACYVTTDQATLGRGWPGIPLAIRARRRLQSNRGGAADKGHYYQVVARDDDDDGRVVATLPYLPPQDGHRPGKKETR